VNPLPQFDPRIDALALALSDLLQRVSSVVEGERSNINVGKERARLSKHQVDVPHDLLVVARGVR
jgi:hypothetical protein